MENVREMYCHSKHRGGIRQSIYVNDNDFYLGGTCYSVFTEIIIHTKDSGNPAFHARGFSFHTPYIPLLQALLNSVH